MDIVDKFFQEAEAKKQEQSELSDAIKQVSGVVINVDDDKKDIVRVSIADELLNVATAGAKRLETPSMYQREYREAVEREADYRSNMRELIDASKTVVNGLFREQMIEAERATEAGKKLYESVERQLDSADRQFVNVTGQPTLEATQKIAALQQAYPTKFIEPVDFSAGLEGVAPREEMFVPKIERIMHVNKPMKLEDLPDEIHFTIPNQENPTFDVKTRDVEVDLTGLPPSLMSVPTAKGTCIQHVVSLPPEDLVCETARYVHFDTMPDQLQRVIRMYLMTLHTNEQNEGARQMYLHLFKESVGKLYEQLSAVVKEDEDDE
jgi:hypothetical protein